ncbi:MAG: hypothetical protein GY862_17430 [Gammaproteobacteria bacterium]|nr:hypothetical protein [Gammaproteobacteria bacterium]
MTRKVVKFVDGDVTILVETDEEEADAAAEQEQAGPAGIIEDAVKAVKSYAVKTVQNKFTEAMGIVSYASNTLLEEIDKIKDKPDEAQVEFGVKITGKGEAMVASGGVEANYKITLSWKNRQAR